MSPTGEVEVVNLPMLEYFGNTVEDVKRWVEGDIIHPADVPHVADPEGNLVELVSRN